MTPRRSGGLANLSRIRGLLTNLSNVRHGTQKGVALPHTHATGQFTQRVRTKRYGESGAIDLDLRVYGGPGFIRDAIRNESFRVSPRVISSAPLSLAGNPIIISVHFRARTIFQKKRCLLA